MEPRIREKEVYDAVMTLQRHTGSGVDALVLKILKRPDRPRDRPDRVSRFADKPVLLATPAEDDQLPPPKAGRELREKDADGRQELDSDTDSERAEKE